MMQLFSADAKTFSKKKNLIFFHPKTWKTRAQELLIIGPNFFFQYCQSAQYRPKSHLLFHKNVSLRDFYIMTLPASQMLHLKGFSFSWTLETCNFRFCFVWNLPSQIVHSKGLSPSWIDAICLFKLGFCVKCALQTVHSNVFSSWSDEIWSIKPDLWRNSSLQIWHSYLFPSWIASTCCFRLLLQNFASQRWHWMTGFSLKGMTTIDIHKFYNIRPIIFESSKLFYVNCN